MARRRQCSFMGKFAFLIAGKRPPASGSSGSKGVDQAVEHNLDFRCRPTRQLTEFGGQ
jgi:hypothetical protein